MAGNDFAVCSEQRHGNGTGQASNPRADMQQFNFPPSTQGSNNNPFQGFMARVKRSSLASISNKKTDDGLIDSGATHNFFHSKKYFRTYQKMKKEDVQYASSKSYLVGYGQVYIPIDGGIYMEGFHAPEFAENIISLSELARMFEVTFFPDDNFESTSCTITSKAGKLLFHTKEQSGLYKMSIPKTDQETPRRVPEIEENEEVAVNCLVCAADASDIVSGSYRPKPLVSENKPLEWHFRTGHLSSHRYLRLSQRFSDVPYFTRSTLEKLFCVPCQQGKTKRATVLPTPIEVSLPLELVHSDTSGPVLASLSGNKYSVAFMDARTTKSDVFFLKKKNEMSNALLKYKNRSEFSDLQTGYRPQKLRLDGAGENMSRAVNTFCTQNGIEQLPSPPCAHQSNGTAQRLIQELWARTRILLFASKLPAQLWTEAMHHENWLRNRLPSSRVGNEIPILLWQPRTRIQFSSVPVFGQPGFAFRYRSHTVPNKKFLARSVHGHFVGMESDETLLRVYIPETKSIILTRKQDFKPYEEERLPSVASLLDGLARQTEIEGLGNEDGRAEDMLVKAFQIYDSTFPAPQFKNRGNRRHLFRSLKFDPRLPRSFKQGILDPG